MIKKIISVFLTLVLLSSILPLSVFAEESEADFTDLNAAVEETTSTAEVTEYSVQPESEASPETVAQSSEVSETTVVPDVSLPDNDELFDGYIDQLFSVENITSSCSNTLNTGHYAGDYLTGQNKNIYDALKEQITQVAAGTVTSTVLSVPVEKILGGLTAEELGIELSGNDEEDQDKLLDALQYDSSAVINALLADCPYELYWYDNANNSVRVEENAFVSPSGSTIAFSNESAVTFLFPVATAYAAAEDYTTNPSEISRANTAADRVRQIVNTAADEALTDYDKLVYYREQICNMVSCYEADGSASEADSDTWQLIYVFDGDISTNVVSDGYAKAFHYLCECTSFTGNVYSLLVDGTITGPSANTDYMWNIVHIDDNNYLVDVTGCDTGMSGYPDLLFLKGADSGTADSGYTFITNASSVTYIYSAKTTANYPSDALTLSTSDYSPSENVISNVTVLMTAPSTGEVLPTDAVSGTESCSVQNIQWYDCQGNEFTGRAECGETYTLRITLQANAGTTFGSGAVSVALQYDNGEAILRSVTSYGSRLIFSLPLNFTHSITHVEAKEATPSAAGNIEYYTCTVCGKYYSDADAQNEIAASEVLTDIPALSTPVLVSARNGADGVIVSWEPVAYANYYRVYRKVSGGNWARIADITADTCSYTDTGSLSTGTTYIYTVRALYNDGQNDPVISGYNKTGVKVSYVAAPKLSSASNATNGITVKWSAVSDATKYSIYRKTSEDNNWIRLSNSVTSTSYTDKNVESGICYIYTVRAFVNTLGCYSDAGVSTTYIPTPSPVSAANSADGVIFQWNPVSDADTYYVYRKTDSSNWTMLGITIDSWYLDSSAQSGTSYTYTVRAYNSACGIKSSYNATGKTVRRLDQPVITGISCAASGLTVRWSAVNGASSYNIYRITDGTWKKLSNVTSTSYTDSSVTSGSAYTYTVRACNDSTMSSYNTDGKAQIYLSVPSLSVANVQTDTASGVSISWNAVSGADSYVVYRKGGSSSTWGRIASDVTELSFLDSSAACGTSYTYTVRAYNSTYSCLSAYNTSGKTVCRIAQPVLVSAVGNGSKIVVKWEKAAGAKSYNVYRRTVGGSWSRLATTTSLSYTDTDCTTGTIYEYTVRGVNGSYLSSFDAAGVSGVRLATPSLVSAVNTEQNNSNGITVTWKSVKAATGYRVYRKTTGESWTLIYAGAFTEPSYFDDSDTLKEGTSYTYTVKATYMDSTSGYSSSGVTCKFG